MGSGTRRITVEIPGVLDDKLERILRHSNQNRPQEEQPATKSGLIQEALDLLAEEYIAKFEDPQD